MTPRPADPEGVRARIAEACRVLGRLDITPGTVGHISARLPGSDLIAIRGRGPAESGVRYTTEGDVIDVDLDGQRSGGEQDGYSAPLEVHIHTQLYRHRPDINAVVHVHPSAVVLLTICDVPLRPIYGAYDPHGLRLVLGGIPIFDKSILIERPALGEELAATMGQHSACLMRGHGITTAANSIEEAALVAIHLNDLAKMTYSSHLLGGVRDIAPEEQEVFRMMEINAGYGGMQPGRPSGRAVSLWRYYVRLTSEPGR